MLILSRKLNEQIVIRGNIVVTVIAIRGNHVRLGVEAPREIPVNREEILNSPKQKRPATKASHGEPQAVQLPLPFSEE